MKNRILGIVIIAALLLGSFFFAHAQSKNSAVNATFTTNTNRYAMLAGSYQVNNGKTSKSVNGVFKLDTYTGKTWILKVIKQNDVILEKWIPVTE
jgi:hypothetical protein